MTVQWAKRLAPFLEVTWQELIEGPAPPTVRSRVELLEIFDVIDEQGKEMLCAWRVACEPIRLRKATGRVSRPALPPHGDSA